MRLFGYKWRSCLLSSILKVFFGVLSYDCRFHYKSIFKNISIVALFLSVLFAWVWEHTHLDIYAPIDSKVYLKCFFLESRKVYKSLGFLFSLVRVCSRCNKAEWQKIILNSDLFYSLFCLMRINNTFVYRRLCVYGGTAYNVALLLATLYH